MACGNHLRNVSYQEHCHTAPIIVLTFTEITAVRILYERCALKAYEILIRRHAGSLLLLMPSVQMNVKWTLVINSNRNLACLRINIPYVLNAQRSYRTA